VTEMQLLIEGLKVIGTDAKWTLICYFLLTNATKVLVVWIFCSSVLKGIRYLNEAQK
jgi:hypothetical protein